MLLLPLLACDPGAASVGPTDAGDTGVETDTELDTDTAEPDTDPETVPDPDTGVSQAEVEAAYQAFYDPAVVQIVELELSRGSIQSLRVDPFDYVEGNITINGERFEDVGIRLKGSASFEDLDGKPSWKVKFDEFVDQRFAGLQRATFNNMTSDPSQSKEMIGYALWREAGLLAPRVSYARVSLNGELLGLYTNLESMDENLLARHYEDNSGDLWEGNDYADFTTSGLSNFELVTGRGDAAALEAARRTIAHAPADEFLAQADTVLDMRSFLDFWAYSIAIGNRDGYPYYVNDYFIYGDRSDGRFDFAPWGMDESWDTGMYWSSVGGEVGYGCIADAACVTALSEHTADALVAYEQMDMAGLALGLWALSDTIVREDPRRIYSVDEVLAARETLLINIDAWPARVREQMNLPEPG